MYALIRNGAVEKYPYSVGELRRDNQQISFPRDPSDELLAEYGVLPVLAKARPSFNPATHKVVERTPVLEQARNGDGTFRADDPATLHDEGWCWTQVWEVVPLSATEVQQYLDGLQLSVVEQTQQRLDNFARTRGYDGVLSACTYSDSLVQKFRDEGQYCLAQRDATWAKLYDLLQEVQSGTRPVPSGFSDIEPLLPVLTWPN